MNIALTGPYGSGKSSIIKTFLKHYERNVLQISLAAFLPDAHPDSGPTVGKVSRQEIERSILQQMLYGADAKRLPLSRFKRIQAPGRWSIPASLFMVVGLIACWHLFQQREPIFTGAYFQPFEASNWFNLIAFAIGGGFLWRAVHHLYIASFVSYQRQFIRCKVADRDALHLCPQLSCGLRGRETPGSRLSRFPSWAH